VFFYQDGVSNGSDLTVPANDEFDLAAAWQKLANEHNVSLETCVAAALRRGIISSEEAEQHQLSGSNLASGFTQAGLGSLSEALLTQDRVVQF
jgi:tRNA 2-thiouridine synthesizing protein D